MARKQAVAPCMASGSGRCSCAAEAARGCCLLLLLPAAAAAAAAAPAAATGGGPSGGPAYPARPRNLDEIPAAASIQIDARIDADRRSCRSLDRSNKST